MKYIDDVQVVHLSLVVNEHLKVYLFLTDMFCYKYQIISEKKTKNKNFLSFLAKNELHCTMKI